MDKKNEKLLKRKRSDVDSDEFDENQENIETELIQPAVKRQRMDHRLLTSSLMLIDRTASDGNGKMPSFRSLTSLAMVVEEPEILDGDRTEVSSIWVLVGKTVIGGRAQQEGEKGKSKIVLILF
ncbi:unnamed protein product [Nippostrongylus brasiliensis]|uniref:Nuclear hormone receptor family member nhr-97 (inferred by orthology to a C. elegans protein) n=1 Tax=Nippostrongylus brasiliensis TaxID=27835 RepID=A0A0N4YKK0_NIPBR|nr:unnamed protein product [Nippostrongylus brasiliensis]